MTRLRIRPRGLLMVVVVVAVMAAVGVAAPSTAAPIPRSKPAIFHNGMWFLRDSLTSGPATSTFAYGKVGDIPVMGDWDGDGHDTVGVVRATPNGGTTTYTWYLSNSNAAGAASITPFTYGTVTFVPVDQLGTVPVVGDWDGDGVDTVGVVQYSTSINGPIRWLLRNANTGGAANLSFTYGSGRDQPIVGDWNADGTDTPGVVGFPNVWRLRNSSTTGPYDVKFGYGSSALELHLTGDWNGDGFDTPAVLRNSPPTEAGGFPQWFYRDSNSSGLATGSFVFGGSGQTVEPPIEYLERLSWQ